MTSPDIRQIAKFYIDAGWAVVPLVKGEKRAAASSWQKKTYSPTNFQPDSNIALKCGEPSKWLVDVDLDAIEAVEAGKLLLPATGLVHGRPGKPDSHYWYLCPNAKSFVWKDVKDTAGQTGTLLELRSTGGYTVLPPSVHPSGDVLAWALERDPLSISPEDLMLATRNVGIAVLLARHWPGPGMRHHFAGHLAGFLCRYGLDDRFIVRIIEVAATVAKDPDIKDRIVFARNTVEKFRQDKDAPLTGGPKLAESLGEDVVARLKTWLGAQDDDALEEMNRKHFWVRIGKDDVIGREEDAGVVFQKPRALYSEYANKRVQVSTDKKGEPVYKPLYPTWLEWSGRRSYREVVFAPPPLTCDPQDYNLWNGFAIQPQPGECSLFLEHIRNVICGGAEEHYTFLMNLLAMSFQAPGEPSGIAVAMRGKPGTGKGIFVRALGDIVGRRHFAHVDKVDQIAGRFNSSLSGKIIVFADEAFFAGDKGESGALKRLITEPTLTIERKNIDAAIETNHVHLFAATNENWSAPVMTNDRRWFTLNVSDAHMKEAAYFGAISRELQSGGLAAFLHLMLNRTYDRDALRNPPDTPERREQAALSLSEQERALRHWLQSEEHKGELIIGRTDLFKLLRGRHQETDPGWSDDELAKFLIRKVWPDVRTFRPRKGRRQDRHYHFGLVGEARERFDAKLEITTDWPTSKLDDLVTLAMLQSESEYRKMGTLAQLENTGWGLINLGTTILRKVGVKVDALDKAEDEIRGTVPNDPF